MITPTKPTQGVTDLDIVRSALESEYDDVKELGRGGMAIVYRAKERSLDRDVAIKVLPFTLAFDENLVERFTREARTAAKLEHPHIIPIHRVGQAGQVTYFTMTLLRGQSLSDRLLESGPLSPADTRRVLIETASALGYAHQHGVVHRDVKPDNILLDEHGRCIVTDFGIARSGSDSKLTATGTSVGTPRYMSPEQARAKDVDGRSDVYSLGIVGYECLTGRVPFDGDDMMAILMAHITQPPPTPTLSSPEARSVYAVIARMIAKEPEQRYRNAEEAVAALQAPFDTTVAVTPEVVSPPGSRARRALEEYMPRLRSAQARVDAVWTRVRGYAASNPRRFWSVATAALVLGVGGPVASHFGIQHRSRCIAVTDITKPAPFTVLVDDLGSTSRKTDVYYDVCGLAEGTRFTTLITVNKDASALKRLFAAAPLSMKFEETATGSAERRHRTLDLSGKSAGTYVVAVTVTDAKGRRREETARVQLRGDK